MKKIRNTIIIVVFIIIYLIVGKIVHFYIPCPIHELTGFYCPGCGMTRMLISILRLDFYKALRYNPLAFMLLPVAIVLVIDNLYKSYKNKTPIYKKIDDKIWYVLIFILLVYGILRNIYPILAPIN